MISYSDGLLIAGPDRKVLAICQEMEKPRLRGVFKQGVLLGGVSHELQVEPRKTNNLFKK